MCYMKRTLSNKKTVVANEPKTKQPIVSTKTVKLVEKKTIVSAPKNKSTTKKIKSVDSTEKSCVQTQKTAPTISAQKTKSTKTKNPPAVSAKAKTKSVKSQPIVSVKQSKAASVKLKAVENKVQKPKTAQTIKTKSATTKTTSSRAKTALPENKVKPKNTKLTRQSKAPKVVKTIEKKVEIAKPTVVRKPQKKKVKPISSAVFRGKKDRYGFEVFPIDAELEDVSAIYVISKRKIDKRKKGHHSLVCIGQTESVLGEIKRHKKGKCVKKYQANVISILPEENEQKRLRIETDLKSAHTLVCTLE